MKFYVVEVERTHERCAFAAKPCRQNRIWKCPHDKETVTEWQAHTGTRSSGQMTIYKTLGYARSSMTRLHDDFERRSRLPWNRGLYGNDPPAPVPAMRIRCLDTDDMIVVSEDMYAMFEALEAKSVRAAEQAILAQNAMYLPAPVQAAEVRSRGRSRR